MGGSALAASVVGGLAVFAMGLAAAGGASAESQRMAGVADAAALAAADAASGAVTGVACERAAEIASAQSAAIVSCSLEGLVATVVVEGRFAGLPVSAAARAGPPL